MHFSDPSQHLVCRLCKVDQHISNYRIKHFTCRECVYLRRYRFGHIKERLREHVKKYNISEASYQIEVKP